MQLGTEISEILSSITTAVFPTDFYEIRGEPQISQIRCIPRSLMYVQMEHSHGFVEADFFSRSSPPLPLAAPMLLWDPLMPFDLFFFFLTLTGDVAASAKDDDSCKVNDDVTVSSCRLSVSKPGSPICISSCVGRSSTAVSLSPRSPQFSTSRSLLVATPFALLSTITTDPTISSFAISLFAPSRGTSTMATGCHS